MVMMRQCCMCQECYEDTGTAHVCKNVQEEKRIDDLMRATGKTVEAWRWEYAGRIMAAVLSLPAVEFDKLQQECDSEGAEGVAVELADDLIANLQGK